MNNVFKQGGYLLVSVFVLGLSLHAAAAVFTCTEANGSKTYTSEPNTKCSADDLGKLSSYHGGGYKLKAESENQSKHERSAKRNKQTKKGREHQQTKAKQEADGMPVVQQ